jgi:hypothetical protein
MNIVHFVTAALLATTLAVADDAAVERWDRAICLHTERKTTDGQPAVASGFIIEHKKSLWLVSAVHVAQDTHARTRIVYRTRTGESRWVHLGGLAETETNPWSDFENSDVSIALIQERPDTTVYYDELKELAIPLDALNTEVPKRTKRIEITGYPMSLGTTPPVTPFAMVAHVASREMPTPARWGNEKIFYAVPSVASGTSGGPVYESNEDPSNATVVGMYIGLINDSTGAKLSKIVPSKVVRTAIEVAVAKNCERAR